MKGSAAVSRLAAAIRDRDDGRKFDDGVVVRALLGVHSAMKGEKEPRKAPKAEIDLEIAAFGPRASAGLSSLGRHGSRRPRTWNLPLLVLASD
jgi:hypothetical protein